MAMKACRECSAPVADSARICPQCGAPWPSWDKFDGYGFEYKSKATLFGLPLLHISFKYRQRDSRTHFCWPVPAVGIIAIGQFAAGVIQISQLGVGLINVAQFAIGGLAVAQFAVAYYAIAQLAACWAGKAQLLIDLKAILL